MKKLFLLLAVAAIPFVSNAQELGLETNYKSKKQQRLSKFKPHRSGDITANIGLSSVGQRYGAHYNAGIEYMINEKLGVRASASVNNLSRYPYWGFSRYSLDATYHFIQNKRWDVYAFAGVALENFRYRFSGSSEASYVYSRPILNGGVGARYRITPGFGIQAEVGRTSSFGIFKKFNFSRK